MSKPTQEQVIAWARDSGFERNTLGWSFTYGKLDYHLGLLATLAYEAGRKDENEACADLVVQCSWNVKGAENALLVDACAAAIRARGNHD